MDILSISTLACAGLALPFMVHWALVGGDPWRWVPVVVVCVVVAFVLRGSRELRKWNT